MAHNSFHCYIRRSFNGEKATERLFLTSEIHQEKPRCRHNRSCGCPLPGSVQGQVGWSSEHPGLVEDVPAHGRGVGTGWSL